MVNLNFKFFTSFLLTVIFTSILIVLLGCTDIPGAEVRNADNILLSEITSRKWKGTATIPSLGGRYADEGTQRVNCFDFNGANGSGVANHEWKSDIYSNGGPPSETYFHHENTTAGIDFTPIFEDMFFFVIRYNTTNNSLGYQYSQINGGKRYSIQQPLSSIVNIATSGTNFNNLSIYMPVYVRNINIATNIGGVSTLEMNFGIQFTAAKTADPQTAISSISGDLNEENKGDVKGILSAYWVDYSTVSDIENGANSCPDF